MIKDQLKELGFVEDTRSEPTNKSSNGFQNFVKGAVSVGLQDGELITWGLIGKMEWNESPKGFNSPSSSCIIKENPSIDKIKKLDLLANPEGYEETRELRHFQPTPQEYAEMMFGC